MSRIINMHVTQIRIFRTDDLPSNYLQLESSVQKIKQDFKFRQSIPLQPQLTPDLAGGIAFGAGEYVSGVSVVVVEQIIIEARRIMLTVASSSEIANQVFSRLKEVIRELDQRENKGEIEPLILAQDTITVVKLDFPMSKLFAIGPMGQFVNGLTSKVEKYGAEVTTIPTALRFRVSYHALSEDLKLSNIELVDKEIVIERRVNTAIEENIYFISSPSPSDIHLNLILYIEKVFGSQ